MKSFYITTTLPYVNADPHIGFALEIVQADAVARYQRLLGKDVIFNTGTDEHGLKIYRKALENKEDPQEYCNRYAARFDALKQALNLSYTHFIRTTEIHHMAAAQEFWRLCLKNGDIYKKNYKVKYCVGCELEKTDSELVDDRCPIHPNLKIELIEEENYFFKFSKFQKPLLKFYEKNPNFVVPSNRLLEIKNFVEKGLEDFSISRLKSKMPWGVSVPGDEDQVMYVWFDALINYISTLGWPSSATSSAEATAVEKATAGKPQDEKNFKKFWPGVQVAGKDNLRQQSAMWQAMLMSAGLPNSEQVFIHGFITSDGQKMSKSLGNVVDPFEIVKKYGTDAARYFLLGGLPSYDDGDFTIARFEEFYTAHLVNGIGNLTSRILTMLEKYSDNKIPAKSEDIFDIDGFWKDYGVAFRNFEFDGLIEIINNLVAECDGTISSQKPWEKAKKGEDISDLLYQLAETLRHLAVALLPIIPESAEKILKQLNTEDRTHTWGKLKKGDIIKKGDILFPRLT